MAQKMTGALVFDERTDRYDIRFDLNSYYGGLHCGECFDVFVRGKWKPTRIIIHSNRAKACKQQKEDFFMAQRTGALVFDERTDRYDIRFDLNTYYGGLHCGECFDVFVRGKWKPTRIEYGDNWYLVGIRAEDLNGLRVRI